MQRNLTELAQTEYDVLVIGGGIYGACVAWDATLRGLRVALVERGDFAGGTSANSLKTIHGGLRYLQDGNPLLVRKMIAERKAWLRIAPHLIQPLPFVLPADRGSLTRTPPALWAAARAVDLLGFDRNAGLPPAQRLPGSRLLSRAELRRLGLPDRHSAMLWYDGQMSNAERVVLALLLAATKQGATVANYVEVCDIVHDNAQVHGAVVRDACTGDQFEVRAGLTINCAGHKIDALNASVTSQYGPRFYPSLALNLVTRQVQADYAVGVTGTHGQTLFVVPWREYSMLGTLHLPVHELPPPDTSPVTLAVVQDFIAQVNAALPAASLTVDDVYRVHWGYLPTVDQNVRLLREGRVHDHAVEDGIDGLISVVGVKFTTARMIAQQAVDLVFRKRGQQSPACMTAATPIHGGQSQDTGASVSDGVLPASAQAHLARTYGSAAGDILRLIEARPELGQSVAPDSLVTAAEIIHAVRYEMALTLADIVLRRTELGTARLPGPVTLAACAYLMAAELGWDMNRQRQEIEHVERLYPNLHNGMRLQ